MTCTLKLKYTPAVIPSGSDEYYFLKTCVSLSCFFNTLLDYLWIQFSASLGYFFKKSAILFRTLKWIATAVYKICSHNSFHLFNI